ncbi:MAG: hypothetical protein IIC50_10215 [Planctomycetes bacterium]|nr:hypothetical protein [Planctomycetota bacterium]
MGACDAGGAWAGTRNALAHLRPAPRGEPVGSVDADERSHAAEGGAKHERIETRLADHCLSQRLASQSHRIPGPSLCTRAAETGTL